MSDLDPRKPEEAVAMLRAGGGGSNFYTAGAAGMVKALLEDGRLLPLRIEGDRYVNLEEVMDTCHDVIDRFQPSAFQAGWAVKVAFELRPYWDAAIAKEKA